MHISYKTKRLVKKCYTVATTLFILIILIEALYPFSLPWFATIGSYILAILIGTMTLVFFLKSPRKDLLALIASILLLFYGGKNLFYAIYNSL